METLSIICAAVMNLYLIFKAIQLFRLQDFFYVTLSVCKYRHSVTCVLTMYPYLRGLGRTGLVRTRSKKIFFINQAAHFSTVN